MPLPISVVIPLAPGETAWRELLPQLNLPKGSEIILAIGEQAPELFDCAARLVQSPSGRAQQLNAGAAAATTEVLWFLHADTVLGEGAIEKLLQCLSSEKAALWFFDLKFMNDGPEAMKWNEWAVRWRAGSVKIPFGDQGFCISKERFEELGGYREDLAYGEDHVFVWKVRQAGYSVERVGAAISTSARKYEKGGWLNVTWGHVWRTVWQAAPQAALLIWRKISRSIS